MAGGRSLLLLAAACQRVAGDGFGAPTPTAFQQDNLLAYNMLGGDVTCTQAQLEAYIAFRITPALPCNPDHYSGVDPTKYGTFYNLDFSDYDSAGPGNTKIVHNNLGGQGPNNCCVPGLATVNPNACVKVADTSCTVDNGYIEIRDVARYVVDNREIHVRIYNTSVYRPADFGVEENKFQRQQGTVGQAAGGGFWQINLRPVYNELTFAGDLDPDNQPFSTGQIQQLIQIPAALAVLTKILPDLGTFTYDARFSNTVNLFYYFCDVNGAPIELDEFLISFFDFDQDYADGTNAFIRETLIIYDFETAFFTRDTELERRFSRAIFETEAIINVFLQGIPVRTVESIGPGPDFEPNLHTVQLHGAVVRSTIEGTGPPQAVKYTHERCMGYCNTINCTASRDLTQKPNAVQLIGSTFCGQGQACGPSALPSPLWAWTGCGFSNQDGFFTAVATGLGPDQSTQTSKYSAGSSVACELDCPRTVVSFDDGNPVATDQLTDQQKRRSVSFLFRKTSNFTVQYRTEIGSGALVNINNDLFNVGDNIGNPARFKGAPVSWASTVDGPGYNPNLGRIARGNAQDAKGRNFLVSGVSSLVQAVPAPPPPPSPPPLPPCPCENTCFTLTGASAFNGVCEDGGPGSSGVTASECAFGTDCADCGGRGIHCPPPPRPPPPPPPPTLDPLPPPPPPPSPPPPPPPSPPPPPPPAPPPPCPCLNTCVGSTFQPGAPGPFNGVCDDGGPGSMTGVCAFGTDCADCGGRGDSCPPPPPAPPPPCPCFNTCFSAFNGICEDGGVGSFNSICGLGTDCADCGGRGADCPPPPPAPPPPCPCSNNCVKAFDGVCDDGGFGSEGSSCSLGDDCFDCGGRGLNCPPPPMPPPPPPPPPNTVPPPPPPFPQTTSCTACLDPHLTFAHGGRADFKGKDKTWYPMLSARNTTFSTYFVHDDFKNPNKVVHGSAMKAAAWVLRTNVTGTIITVEYNASSAARTRALVRAKDSLADAWIYHGSKPFKIENVRVEMRERKLAGAGKGAWHGTALLVSTDRWQMSVWNKPYPNAAVNPGKALLNIHIEALYDADTDSVAPHGLIGQSYDGDNEPVDGRLDEYKGKEITTSAMAEGAIEGTASEYELAHKFATRFKYSRFDAAVAKRRDVSRLAKPVADANRQKAAGATADLEDDEA